MILPEPEDPFDTSCAHTWTATANQLESDIAQAQAATDRTAGIAALLLKYPYATALEKLQTAVELIGLYLQPTGNLLA